jgi:hypothetical protein
LTKFAEGSLKKTTGEHPIILGALLALAWRNAGWIGLDRLLLAGLPSRRRYRVADGRDVGAEVVT